MIFLAVGLLVAVGLALAISAGAGSMFGLGEYQTGQVVVLIAVLLLIVGGAFGRRRRLKELFSGIVLWGLIFGIAIVGYTFRDELRHIPQQVYAELNPGSGYVDTKEGTVSFVRSGGGSFSLNGSVNGAKIQLIFDTGASAVVLTEGDARAAGIDTDNLSYTLPVQTANGTGYAAPVSLKSVEVGGIERDNVRAYVVGDHALETSLLGMSFLETLSGYSVTNDKLELRE